MIFLKANKAVIFLLFCFFFLTEINSKAQSLKSIDSYLVESVSEEITHDFLTNLGTEEIFIDSKNEELLFLFQTHFLNKGFQIVSKLDSTVVSIDISTKGTYFAQNKHIYLDGIFLVKLYKNNSLMNTKRYSISESVAIANVSDSSILWEKVDGKSNSRWKRWSEPALILSVMILSVYLLFSVRS